MAVGMWGSELLFSTSDHRILTFRDFNRTVSATWTSHNRIGMKDSTEFVRPNLQKVTFTIDLNDSLGVSPRLRLELLESAVESGVAHFLLIGTKRVGKNMWRCTETSEAWDTVLDRGVLVSAKVDVTLEEYVV